MTPSRAFGTSTPVFLTFSKRTRSAHILTLYQLGRIRFELILSNTTPSNISFTAAVALASYFTISLITVPTRNGGLMASPTSPPTDNCIIPTLIVRTFLFFSSSIILNNFSFSQLDSHSPFRLLRSPMNIGSPCHATVANFSTLLLEVNGKLFQLMINR